MAGFLVVIGLFVVVLREDFKQKFDLVESFLANL